MEEVSRFIRGEEDRRWQPPTAGEAAEQVLGDGTVLVSADQLLKHLKTVGERCYLYVSNGEVRGMR